MNVIFKNVIVLDLVVLGDDIFGTICALLITNYGRKASRPTSVSLFAGYNCLVAMMLLVIEMFNTSTISDGFSEDLIEKTINATGEYVHLPP